ncbi:MAG: SCO family protein [Candidatus Rokubacteria bacterium]|nr:SCO family protein [Candidatus Rokubacteria bacterium]
MRRRGLLAFGATALGLALTGAALASLWRQPQPLPAEGILETLADYGLVPDFRLTERGGSTVTLADLRGKVWFANFIYTECTETCPLQSLQVQRLQKEFVGSADLRFVSITVDPGHDTPEVLRRYAERYGADPGRWLFLTGPKPAIYGLAKDGFKLGVSDASPAAQGGVPGWPLGPAPAFASHGSGGLILHSSRFVLVDRQARIRAYHRTDDPDSLARLRENLRALLAGSWR